MPIVRIIGLVIAKTLSKIFGLATITFFGRVPSRDDAKAGGVGLISVIWLVVLAAIPFPSVGHTVFPFIDEDPVIRVVAAGFAVVLPPIAGFIVASMHNRRHERGLATLREMVFGYGYCTIIGVLVVLLVVVVPIVKVSYIFRLFDLRHIAVMVADGTYDDVVRQIRGALKRHGMETEVSRPHWTIYRIFTALAWIEGHIFRRHVAREMLMLEGETSDGDSFEVTVHATDISILGRTKAAAMVMAVLSEELDERYLYLTWDDDAQELEDRIQELSRRLEETGEPPEDEEISELCDRLRGLSLETEEWNAVRRQLFRLECASLRTRNGQGQVLEDAAAYVSTSEEDASAASE